MQPRIESRQDWLEEAACRRAKGVTIRRSDGSGEPSGRPSERAFPVRSPAPGINGLESHPRLPPALESDSRFPLLVL